MAEAAHQAGVVDFADRIVVGLWGSVLGLLFFFGHGWGVGASFSIVRGGAAGLGLCSSNDAVFFRPAIFQLRQRSLARGIVLALVALAGSMRLAGFPALDALRASNWQIVAASLACCSMVETYRCLGRKWTLYGAGVLILLYAELMILVLTLFLLVYP